MNKQQLYQLKLQQENKVKSDSNLYFFTPIHPALQPYIERIGVERLDLLSESGKITPYKVLPGPSIVMGFQCRGRLQRIQATKSCLLERSGISGLQTTYRVFQGDKQTRTVLVWFKPWGISAFFPEPASLFANEAIGLNDLLSASEVALLEEQLTVTTDSLTLSYLIQTFLLKHLLQALHKKAPANLVAAAQTLLTTAGTSSIARIAKSYGFSERSLERKFNLFIGLGPKKFASLARFQKAVALLPSATDYGDVGYQLQYYDESHFIKEFKQFSGLTPQQFTLTTLE